MKRLNHFLLSLASICLLVSGSAFADCNSYILPTTPDNKFLLHSDGTVTDTQTDLMWYRCSMGQSWTGGTCEGNSSEYNWTNALANAESAINAGYNDWRLPNIKELASIIEEACFEPAINTTVFPHTPSEQYWSSTQITVRNNVSFSISFRFGIDLPDSTNENHHIRLVRDLN